MRFPTFPIILIAALLTACSPFRADGVEDAPRAERAFAVLESAGFPYASARGGVRVLFTEMEPWRQGYFLPAEGEIHISPSMSEDQIAMTLAHEFVHAWRWQRGLAPGMRADAPLRMTQSEFADAVLAEEAVAHAEQLALARRLGKLDAVPNSLADLAGVIRDGMPVEEAAARWRRYSYQVGHYRDNAEAVWMQSQAGGQMTSGQIDHDGKR